MDEGIDKSTGEVWLQMLPSWWKFVAVQESNHDTSTVKSMPKPYEHG